LHVDLAYTAGASANCRDGVCCHTLDDGTVPANTAASDLAGPFGHKNCDTPLGGLRYLLK